MAKKADVRAKAALHRIHRVEDLVLQTAASTAYRSQWLDSANNGFNRRLLRAEHARNKQARLPVWEYFKDLAGEARITLDAAFAAIGLTSEPIVSRSTAGEIAEKLKSIGFSAQEALHSMMLSYAESRGYSVASSIPASARRGQISEAQRCEEVLRRTEAKYPAALRQEVGEIRQTVLQRFSNEW